MLCSVENGCAMLTAIDGLRLEERELVCAGCRIAISLNSSNVKVSFKAFLL